MQAIFDSHFHVIDPDFPLTPNDGFLPEAFGVGDYLDSVGSLPVLGGAVVSGSFQGFDQEYLLQALDELGPGFVGVTQIPATTDDAELRRLAAHDVRAVRFNLYRGGSAGPEQLLALGRRAWDVAGMHVEVYVDAADLPDLEATLAQLPLVSIDHLGMSADNRECLLRLVEGGLRVKATGFGRVNLDVQETLRAVHAANPHALMFGTDLPSTRARRPFRESDLTVIAEALGEAALPAVLYTNALDFYAKPD